ncbi:MAG TPA: hypothetical protein VFT06_12335 [Flavisolibacter sp.]|nr:hypothetical protein [Flavisolibacter sp.]
MKNHKICLIVQHEDFVADENSGFDSCKIFGRAQRGNVKGTWTRLVITFGFVVHFLGEDNSSSVSIRPPFTPRVIDYFALYSNNTHYANLVMASAAQVNACSIWNRLLLKNSLDR